MMRTTFSMGLAAIALLAGLHAARAQNATPLGLWQATDDDTKQPSGWFLIGERDGLYNGIIAKMFLKPGEDPNAPCDKCKDDRHNHPWLGLEIIRGMKQNGDKYEDGTILDPRDGSVYRASMRVSPDGQTLIVRGFIGFALLGQNQYWSRLPETAYSQLDPAINPNPASIAKPGARKPDVPHNAAQR